MTTTTGGADVSRLFGAGAHFAQAKSRRHPSMKPFILGMKARVEIVDLAKTEEQLIAAKQAMEVLAAAGKTVMFVGGKTEVSGLVRDAALKIDAPYVAGRWLGGTISNFVEIKKRIDRLADLTEKRDSGELAKRYTKLERVKIDREVAKLTNRLEGITGLTKKPDALLIVDTRYEAHAVKEAKDAGIPVIAIMGSDCNLRDAAYPIVANDASRATVSLILNELVSAFEKGRAA
jgi:small subunit ribosomal protein S2